MSTALYIAKLPELIHRGTIPTNIIDVPGFRFQFCMEGMPFRSAALLKISPFGLEFDVDAQTAKNLQNLDFLRIRLFFGGQKDPITEQRVALREFIPDESLGFIVVASFVGDGEDVIDANTKRKPRWHCNPTFLPTGIWKNPFILNDTIFLKLKGFSDNFLEVETSRDNVMIFRGMVVHGSFTFVEKHAVPISFRITDIRESNGEGLTLRGTPLGYSEEARFALGGYLAEFTQNVSYEEILDAGFYIENFTEMVTFECATMKDEKAFEEIMDLRTSGYETDASLMKDKWDSRSVFIIARWHGKPVGTARLVYHDGDQQFEQEESCGRTARYPDNNETVEVTRITIAKGFRNSGLLQQLIAESCLHIVASGRRWLLGSAPGKLLPMYESVGVEAIDAGYTMTDHAKPVELTVIKADMVAILGGGNIGPIAWNLTYRGPSEFLRRCDIYRPNMFERCRIGVYSALGFLARRIRRKQMMGLAERNRRKKLGSKNG